LGEYQSTAYTRIRRRDCADRMDRNRWPKVTVKKYGWDEYQGEAESEL
jgi:hypothetical protein